MRNLDEGGSHHLAAIRTAALDPSPVAGLTHCHYKYPARFSPKFVASVIEAFSSPGDLVLDPYMGGGTTLVECMSRNRRAVGCDINRSEENTSELQSLMRISYAVFCLK